MSTSSLRRDHDLIEKVINAMELTTQLLKENKKIPQLAITQVIDFTKNFTDVCHHSKEENSLFPALEQAGMPRNMGPIAVMLMEHEVSRKIAKRMEDSANVYFESGDSSRLVSDMAEYIDHIRQHLWKENNRLFMMADMRLQGVSEEVSKKLVSEEESKLKEIGKTRQHYEDLANTISKQLFD
jgi:hemerythrin-like domain-containing protein